MRAGKILYSTFISSFPRVAEVLETHAVFIGWPKSPLPQIYTFWILRRRLDIHTELTKGSKTFHQRWKRMHAPLAQIERSHLTKKQRKTRRCQNFEFVKHYFELKVEDYFLALVSSQRVEIHNMIIHLYV